MTRTAFDRRGRGVAPLGVLVAFALAACGGSGNPQNTPDGSTGPIGNGNAGAPVGAPCTMASQCESPNTPLCLQEIKPLAEVAGVPADIASFGLTFAQGYCSSVLNCSSDAHCGTGGSCFRPFADVEAQSLRDLEQTFSPPITSGSLDFLTSFGVCLETCETAADCEGNGYVCEAPLATLISAVPGAVNDTKFCVPVAGCESCDANATCDTTSEPAQCVCKPGYTGDGTTCSPTSTGGGGNGSIGSPCSSLSECASPGTPACFSSLAPLAGIEGVPPNLQKVGLDFPNGYCSSQPNCSADLQCGAGGRCFQPFREVTAETLRALEQSFENLNSTMTPLRPHDLDFLGTYGVCLRTCTDSFECGQGQVCERPLAELIELVPGAINTRSYCVPNDDCEFCGTNSWCDTSSGGGVCKCRPGYMGSGYNCAVNPNGPCDPNPCNVGTCTAVGQNFTCACPQGYSGTLCQIAPPNPCSPNPCLNGSACTMAGTGYTCGCVGGYTGTNCQTPPPNACVTQNNPCGANGDCAPSGASYTCTCRNGYTGTNCTVAPVGPCASAPCGDHGVCSANGESYTCACTGGYTGASCQTPPNACQGNPCGANGTCAASGESYACTCSTGWTGATCSDDVDECALEPCQNGAICTNTAGSYACTCTTGWTGNQCQQDVDECDMMTPDCSGHGTCSNTPGSYTCACDAGWTGPSCESEVPTSCGAYTDVVYRVTARFEIKDTAFGAGNQAFTGLTNNQNTPPFVGANMSTPFTGAMSSGTFTQGFVRLRFTNDANGAPTGGAVRLVEWYVPLEFTQTAGATLYANNDHSVGIINNPGSLSNCGGGDSACSNHQPSVNRACAPNASGMVAGTTLTWGACTAWSGAKSWNYVSARGATGVGCATGYNQYGNNTSSSSLVPASGKGDAYQTYNQRLSSLTFSSNNYLTASWTMPDIQIPNGTGASTTWLRITAATPIATDCGTTPGVDLVCNVQ